MSPTHTTYSNKQIGSWGEQITANYYVKNGFKLLGMNYWKKWGEIDAIVQKAGRVHFVEVKTVSYETKKQLQNAISHETWRPEENVHRFKLLKLSRVIDSWLAEDSCDLPWQIDVAAVRIVPRETFATINIIENVILE